MTFDTDLRQQLESGPVAHLIGGLSAPLDLTFVSSEVEVLTGYGPERFLGDCSFLMGRVHPEDESEVSRALEQLASAERLDFDFRFRHADGIWRRLRASFEPLSGADGQSSQIVGSLRDITPRKEIERALLQMEERLRVIVEESIQGVLVHRHWKPLYANQAYADLLGYDSPAEILALDSIRRVYAPHEQKRLEWYQVLRMKGGDAPSYYEYDALRKDGSQVTLQNLVRAVDWEGERATLHACIDVTERRLAEAGLRKSESLFRQAQAMANIGHWEWDEVEHRMIDCSEQCALILGMTIEECINKFSSIESHLETIHPDDRERYLQVVQDGDAQLKSIQHEFRIIRPDGSVRYVQEVATPVVDRTGKLVRSVGTIQDVTERRQAEEALRATEEHERLILASAGEGIYEVDLEGRATFVNPAAATLLGFEPEELVGRTMHDLIHHSHPDGSPYPREHCPIYAAFTDGRVYRHLHEVFWRKDGSSFPVHYTSTPVYRDGAVTGAVVIFADVADRKAAEDALRKSELRFSEAARLARLGHWEWDKREGRLVACSEQLAEILEMSVEDALSNLRTDDDWLRLVHPEDRERYLNERNEADAKLEPLVQEYRLVTRAGNVRWVRKQATPVVDDHGILVRTVGTLQDITEYRLMEDEVRRSQARLQAFIDHYPEPVFIKSDDGRLELVNPAYARYVDATPEEILGKSVTELFGPELAEYVNSFDRIVLDERRSVSHETQYSKDGQDYFYQTVKFPIAHPGSDQIDIGGIDHDLTERKKMEKALRNREEQLRLITNSVPALIVFFDRDCRFRFANRTAERWYARSADSIQGETISEVLGKANFERLKPHVERVLGGNADAFDTTIDYPDGVTRHTHQTYTPRFDDDGKVTGFYAMVLDISDRVRAESALREKERQIDAIFDHSPVEIILKDAEGRYVRVNREFEQALNVRSDDLVGKLPSDVYIDSLAEFARSHDLEVLQSGKPVTREISTDYGIRSEDRTELIVKFPVFDAGGAVAGLGAIVSDITERKRAEEALRRSEQQLRLISDSLPVLIIYFDTELRYRFVNKTAETWYARPRNAILGRTVDEILGEATSETLKPYFEKALQGVNGVYEEKIPYPDGVTRDVHAIYVSERENGDKVTGFYVLVMDLTVRRTAEALVRRSRTNLRKLAERLETAREEERRAVAYEIHDDIGQLLTALKLAVFEALQENAEFSPETSTNKELVSELFDKLFEKVRSLARRLRPGLLDELGLEESIVVQVEEMAGHMGWEYTCDIDMNGHQIPKTHETVVFRFVQEALTNAARHAQADHVDIVVDAGDEGITVEVIDDGRGISPVEVDSSDSLGLIGMRERAGSVGGRMEVRRRKTKGTVVRLYLPLPEGTSASTRRDSSTARSRPARQRLS